MRGRIEVAGIRCSTRIQTSANFGHYVVDDVKLDAAHFAEWVQNERRKKKVALLETFAKMMLMAICTNFHVEQFLTVRLQLQCCTK